MILTPELVAKLAGLSRLSLSEKELSLFQQQLNDILTFFEMLKEVDTSSTPPVAQITGLSDVMRDDVINESTSAEELLACSPLGIEKNHIRTQKTFS